MNSENPAKIYVIETNMVSIFPATRVMRKKKGAKNGLKLP